VRMIFPPESAETIAATVSEMVAIKALSGHEAPMASYVEAFLAGANISCRRDAHDNILAVLEPKNPGAPDLTLHLSGHTDTVVPVEGWQTDPWTPLLSGAGDERRLTGLGTSDMKSGLAVMLHILRWLKQEKNQLKRLRVAASFT